MSVLPAEHGEGWTFADLEDMPEDDLHRYEVVDGALLVSPAPADWHQAIARRLFRQLDRQCPPAWEVLYETAFRVGDNGRVPDLAGRDSRAAGPAARGRLPPPGLRDAHRGRQPEQPGDGPDPEAGRVRRRRCPVLLARGD